MFLKMFINIHKNRNCKGASTWDLVLIAYAQESPLNTQAELSSSARGLIFGLSLYLYPYFVYSSSRCSGESAHLHSLTGVSVPRQYDKFQHQNIVCPKPLNMCFMIRTEKRCDPSPPKRTDEPDKYKQPPCI